MPVAAPAREAALSLIRKSRGRMFRHLFNLHAWLRGVDVRVRRDPGGKLVVYSAKESMTFFHEAQAYYACKRGFVRRAELLGDAYLLPRVSFAPGDVVVDCGANVGELKLYFTHRGIPVEYIGIEPSPLEYECLKENVAPSATFNVGLWNTEGTLDFFVSSQMADSSLIEPRHYDEVVKVATRRLDRLLPDKRIKLLKVEAEGAEPEVVEGCLEILPNIEYVSADVGFERGVAQANTLAPVTNFLLAHGFELVDVGFKRLVALYRNKVFA
jgi:FkbM family methyltransferase